MSCAPGIPLDSGPRRDSTALVDNFCVIRDPHAMEEAPVDWYRRFNQIEAVLWLLVAFAIWFQYGRG
jgi:hypothetical protein